MTAGGNDPAWITGFISASSIGVGAWLFDPDVDQELYFDEEFLHGRKLGTNLWPHVHFSPMDDTSGVVRFGIEYTWQQIGHSFPSTTTLYVDYTIDATNAKKHWMASWSSIDGSTINTVSSILKGRVFRNSSHANDTYAGKIAVHYIDCHYQINTIGSRQEASK